MKNMTRVLTITNLKNAYKHENNLTSNKHVNIKEHALGIHKLEFSNTCTPVFHHKT